jgi:hypothetical protein
MRKDASYYENMNRSWLNDVHWFTDHHTNSKMIPDKSQDPSLRTRSGDTSLDGELRRNTIQHYTKGYLPPMVRPFLPQRAQPMSPEKLQPVLQAALDLTSSDDFDLEFELDEEFEALERSVVD